jgi:hypothetical protein
MKTIAIGLLAGLTVGLADVPYAYDIRTHFDLSGVAAVQSVLGDANFRSQLGLRYPIDSMDRAQIFPGTRGEPTSVRNLIANGAIYEDDFPPGPIYHFFDPRTNLPLRINSADYPTATAWSIDFINSRTRTSPDWVLLGQGSSPYAVNYYSFPKAREYLLAALTSPNRATRLTQSGLLFDSLGRMIHHIQDMAQPQHVRNDNHLSSEWVDVACGFGVETLSLCQSYLALRRESTYESWTDKSDVRSRLPLGGYDPVYPGSGSPPDGIKTFTTPRQFWTNSGKGIAEFTNRNFFSAGTMDQAPPFTNAPFDVDVATLCNGAVPSCGVVPSGMLVTFFPSYVDDQFRSGDGPSVHPYAASASIFDPEFNSYSGQRLRTVNRFTFAKDHQYLIPRAVAYSAGLINYFFRGQLEVKASDDGVYAIVDNSPANLGTNGCGTPCGFRKVKLKVRNTTPNDEMINDAANMGTLVVVAKFHLNNCFQSDLSGEFEAAGYRGAFCRSTDEFVAVSNPNKVLTVGRAFPAQATEFTFPSDSPIPINATDLFLQVVYSGTLGSEIGGAVAVTTVDMQEPTYLIFANHNDYVNVYNPDGSYLRTDPYQPAGRFSIHVDLRFNQSALSPIATSAQLDPGYYHRLAILTDQEFLPYWIVEQYIGAQADTREFTLAASENQTDVDGQVFNFPAYVQLRRTTPTAWAYESDDDGGAVYWIPGTVCADDTTRCVPEDKEVGAIARRYPPFRQATPLPMGINF